MRRSLPFFSKKYYKTRQTPSSKVGLHNTACPNPHEEKLTLLLKKILQVQTDPQFERGSPDCTEKVLRDVTILFVLLYSYF